MRRFPLALCTRAKVSTSLFTAERNVTYHIHETMYYLVKETSGIYVGKESEERRYGNGSESGGAVNVPKDAALAYIGAKWGIPVRGPHRRQSLTTIRRCNWQSGSTSPVIPFLSQAAFRRSWPHLAHLPLYT